MVSSTKAQLSENVGGSPLVVPALQVRWSHLRLFGLWQTPVFGLGRTVIAMGSLLTLLMTPTVSLWPTGILRPDLPFCSGASAAWKLPCVWEGHTGAVRLVFMIVLIGVVVGIRPRWTALPHWYVQWCLFTTLPYADGGEQFAIVATTLITPLLLLDGRKWHWGLELRPPGAIPGGIAHAVLLLIRLQLLFVYLQASFAKVIVPEWRDGTALWYFSRNYIFGFDPAIQSIAESLFAKSIVIVAATWGSLLVEAFIGFSFFGGWRIRITALSVGLVFHTMIMILMGLASFMFAAAGLLILGMGVPALSIKATKVSAPADRSEIDSAETTSIDTADLEQGLNRIKLVCRYWIGLVSAGLALNSGLSTPFSIADATFTALFLLTAIVVIPNPLSNALSRSICRRRCLLADSVHAQ